MYYENCTKRASKRLTENNVYVAYLSRKQKYVSLEQATYYSNTASIASGIIDMVSLDDAITAKLRENIDRF